MPRRSLFRSGGGDGGSGGAGKSKKQLKRQHAVKLHQQASLSSIEPFGPQPTALFHSQSQTSASVADDDDDDDDDELHKFIDQLYHQNPTQSPVSKLPLLPHYDSQLRTEADVHSQQYLSESAGQPYKVESESMQHEANPQLPTTNRVRRRGTQKHHIASAVAVEDAVDEIWRCRIDDFRSASLAIQNLRLAILADWESRQLNDRENNATMMADSSKFSFDPSDTFLSLQGATLRFHAQFELMKAERDADQLSRKTGAQHAGDESVADSTTVTTNCQSLNGVEWELTEQAAWEVWEEAIRASAALAHTCVGPAWRRQLKLRRQLIRERLPHQQFEDVQSSGSGEQLMSSSFSPDIEKRPLTRSRSSACERSVDSSIWEPPTDVLDMISCMIPEVLPAAMIRFAASVLETSIPPLRAEDTRIYWDSPYKRGIAPEGCERLLSSLGQHIQDERRWLRRRKRLSDAQRDLALGLFCGGEEKNNVVELGRSGTQGTSSENRWSIPGVHTPVMYMIYSWLDICQASLIRREIEDRNIPYHFEELNELSTLEATEGKHDESHDGPPPIEILLPIKMSQPGSACDYAERNVAERRKFTFWGELIDASSFDWWYTLRVLRDCSDLVSVGWRPPPSERTGEQIILNLILLAERGVEYFANETNGKSELHDEQIRKGRLVACSCASESLVAMKTLAAREVIPQSALRPLVVSLCRLIYTAETAISSVSNCESDTVQEGDALLEKEILTQQTFVASSSAELLSVLLARETTACPTTEVLVEAVNIDLSIEVAESNRVEVEKCAKIASVAIRALSSAMWGDPPSVVGVPLLRFFWEPLIDIFGSIASTYFHGSNDETNAKFYIAGHETTVILLDECSPSLRGAKGPLLDVVFEIMFAIQRLLRNPNLAALCSTEWESVVRSIDVGVSPWLLCNGDESSSSANNEIRLEAIAIFSQIASFLSSISTASVHPIVDDNSREYLHLFCLRKIAPLLHMERLIATPPMYPAMVGDDATMLAISVIKSWSVIRYLPFKEGDWARRARHLLAEAFLIPKSQSMNECMYIGGYIHHPLVRLEALKSLFNDESIANAHSTHIVSKSDASAGSMKSRTFPPAISIFSLTMNMRELHLVLVNSIILPRLEEILFVTTSNHDTTDCQPNQIKRKSLPSECCAIIENEFLLRRFAVKVLGMLFRSRTGESEKRHHFIELLQSVATAAPYGIVDWVRNTERIVLCPADFFRTCGVLRWEEMKLKLEAIRQIEACLDATFTSLPHTHANVPDILKALCDTARFYSIEHEVDVELKYPVVGRLMMTLASVLPLSRLSCARNGQGILMPRQYVARNIPKDIVTVLSVNEGFYNISPAVFNESLPIESGDNRFGANHGDLAPFVYVRQHESSQWTGNESMQSKRRQDSRPMDGKQGTLVDFEPVASVIKHVLCDVSNSSTHHLDEGMDHLFEVVSPSSISGLPSVLSTISYTILSLLLSHGMVFPGTDDLPWLNINNSSPDVGGGEKVLISRSQAVSDFAGVLGYLIVYQIGDESNNMHLSRTVCSVLVHMSKSDSRQVVQHACCGLISILSSLRLSSGGLSTIDEMHDAALSDCAVSFVEYVSCVLRREATSSSQVLIPLIDALREVIVCSGCLFELPMKLRIQAFLLLFQPSHDRFEVKVVAFQAAVAIINTMSPADAKLMMCFAGGPDKDAKVPKEKRIQPLLIDLLRFRLISTRLRTTTVSCFEKKYHRPSNVHNRLAREALSLETFPVDSDNLGRPKVSAWKVGNTILTLRLGSKQYSGWLEVVVRSPCSRIRRLVQWKKELIIERPGSTLPFWEQLHPRPRESEDKSVSVQNVPSDLKSEKMLTNLARATSVIASFDSLFDGTPSNNSSRHEVDGINFHATMKSDVKSFLHQNPQFRNRNSTNEERRSDGKQAVVGNSRFKRTFSDGHLASLSMSQHENLRDRSRSVFSWLQLATCRDDVDAAVIHELEMMGFSPLALGIPANLIGPTAFSDLSVYDKLMPFTVGSNFNRAISILDRITPFQTHRVGLLYGGPFNSSSCDSNNNNGDEFLTATQAPTDFWEFAHALGDLVPVRHCKYFSGGLDSSESLSDGSFAFVWFGCNGESCELNDPIFVDSMVFFHTVTLMPNRITNRKRHVGNDVVHIVYGLSMNTLDVPNISGHFGFITIYVVPLVNVPMLKVSVRLKEGLDASICSVLDHLVGSWLISRRVGAHFVRNLAMVADVICQSMLEDKLGLVLNTEDRDGRIRDTVRHLAERS